MCDPIVFENITPALYQALEDKAQGAGITFTESSTEQGRFAQWEKYKFQWNYDAAAGRLTVQCFEKPGWVPCFAVENRLRSLVQAAREPVRDPATGGSNV